MSAVETTAETTVPQLADDEIAALTIYATGHPIDRAARELRVGPRTIRRAARRAADGLGADGTVHAVALAVHHGLLDPERLKSRTLPPWPLTPKELRERLRVVRSVDDDRPLHEWRSIAADLRERPGQWVRAAEYDTYYVAKQIAYQVRTAKLAGLSPAGSFEAEARFVDGVSVVYARHVGESGDPS